MAKVKYVLLLPKNYNDGSEVHAAVIDEICDAIMELADGWSLAGTVVGAYRMKDGSKQKDNSFIVWIAIDESKEDALRKLVGEFARKLDQESLYLERTAGTIEFIVPTPEEEP